MTVPTLAAAAACHSTKARIDSIDRLRGSIIALMALEHTRVFVLGLIADPTDVDRNGSRQSDLLRTFRSQVAYSRNLLRPFGFSSDSACVVQLPVLLDRAEVRPPPQRLPQMILARRLQKVSSVLA